MALTTDDFALNTLQWITVSLTSGQDNPDEVGWEFDRPSFLTRQPTVLAEVAAAGFGSVMLEVLPTQTLQAYQRVVEESGLRLAPGYVQVGLPGDYGKDLTATERFRWFDALRRRAEESNYFDLDRVFLAADMSPGRPRIDVASAIGHDFDPARLDRVTDLIGEAAEVLVAEGVKPALHNHVGSWIETGEEYEHVLNAVSPNLLAAGPDLGHLAWAGIDVVQWVADHADRISDLHIKDLDTSVATAVRAVPTPYFDATGQRLVLEPGLGDVPLVEALAELPDSFRGSVIVEVDHPTMDPFDSAKQSWSWVGEHFGAAEAMTRD